MKILITGIAGLIGSSLAKWLVENTDHDVYGVDDLSCGDIANVPHGIRGWTLVKLGVELCDRIFKTTKPDVVYHFAAYAAECLSPFIRHHNYTNNLLATADIVNACINHGTQRLVYTSSMAVYGRGTPPFRETDPVQPIDPYGIAKAACEADIRVASEQHGLEHVVIRPHNVYGPGQLCTQKYRNVLGIWMHRHLNGLPLRVYGDGIQRRAFSWIGDCVEPLYLAGTLPAADVDGQTINLGGSTHVSILEAARTLVDVMGGGEIEHHPPRHEVREAWCTTARSEILLGYRDRTPLAEGLRQMWSWARGHEHPQHWPITAEVVRGLYPYWREDLTIPERPWFEWES